MRVAIRVVVGVVLLACVSGRAQMVMSAGSLVDEEKQRGSSGTSMEAPSTPLPMMMGESHGWTLMLHMNVFAANVQQQAAGSGNGGERGRDAFFSTSWVMPMAQRRFGEDGRAGALTVRAMFSAEPATVGQRVYPLLFQQGETAYGKPIVDGQHPHDFFMELAAMYDVPLGKNALLSLYAAPVGDPAIGPIAYPHRLSASENPAAALGHHQEDSTHIAFNVLTGGVTCKWVRAELSGFHGAEPTEARWHFEPSPNGLAVDSAAGRVTFAPGKDWSAQYSAAHIHSPEALYPNEDQQRQTASVSYHHTFRSEEMPGMKMGAGGMMEMGGMTMAATPVTDLSTTLVWGRTKSLADSSKENSCLAEALLRFASRNYVWTRVENAGRSNELLLTPGSALPVGFEEKPLGHVAAFTFGYDRDFAIGPHLVAAPGAQVTVYHASQAALRGVYGATPVGEVMFVRFRLR